MPFVATSFPETGAKGYAGSIADGRPCTLISRSAEAAVSFGGAVVESGTAKGGQARAITTGDTAVLGIAIRDQSVPAGQNAYAAKDNMRVMTQGAVYLTAGATVVPGDPLYVVIASGVFTNVSTGALLIGKWEADGSSAVLTKASINL